MLLQPDDIITFSPNIAILQKNKCIKIKSPKKIITLDIDKSICDKIFKQGITYLNFKNFLLSEGLKDEDIEKFIDFMFRNNFFTKQNDLTNVLNFNYLTSYDYLKIGVREVNKIEKKEKHDEIPLTNNVNSKILDIIKYRRSVRKFITHDKTSIAKLSTILLAMYGKISKKHRAIASAGKSYDMNILILIYHIQELKPGIYYYNPNNHSIIYLNTLESNSRYFVTENIDFQNAHFSFILTYNSLYICSRYYERGYKYLLIESGLSISNAQLTALELGIKSTIIGGIDDSSTSPLRNYLNEFDIPVSGVVFGYD